MTPTHVAVLSQDAFNLALKFFDRHTKSTMEVYQEQNLASAMNNPEDHFRRAIFTARKIYDTADDSGLPQLYHDITKAMKSKFCANLQNKYCTTIVPMSTIPP